MRLSDLDARTANPNVVILQTPSIKLEMFLRDKLKSKYNCNMDSSMTVEVKKDLKEVRNLVGVTPPNAGKWFIEVDLDKFREEKELVKVIKESTTCLFFITCSKYSQYKSLKDEIKSVEGVFDYYITFLRRPDFIYLYDALTTSESQLTQQLRNYVVQSYSGDIESIMNLLIAMNNGRKVESRRDISDICGIGGNSTESFIFSMLKPLSGSTKGLKTVMKNKITAGLDLGESLGYSTFYNYLLNNLISFIEIKQLVISGTVYKSIRKLPDGYDEKRLSRYNKYLWRIKELPMSDLLRLVQCMGKKQWRSELDFLNFIYKYYAMAGKIVLYNKEEN